MRMLAVSFAALLATSALARPADHPPALLQLLRGIDTVPTAAALAKAAPGDTAAALNRAALDGDLSLYERRRAASLLSAFPGPVAEAYLQSIAKTAVEPPLRWIAVYTYCRTFGASAPARVVSLAEATLKSTEPLDREAAVRGLRFVSGAAATALLDATWAREKDKTVRAALARVRAQR